MNMSEILSGSNNVYEDLHSVDSDVMFVKARLACRIGDIISHMHLTQQQAAEILGISQSKLSGLLRGKFRGISEVKMIECLNLLGRDVEIIIRKTSQKQSKGQTQVTFA
jgi:predicted XRE-type DNA-binding protein